MTDELLREIEDGADGDFFMGLGRDLVFIAGCCYIAAFLLKNRAKIAAIADE